MDEPHRILICLRYGIGDAVMEIPALRGLRRAWPAARLSLLGARPALELFEQDPDFEQLVCIHDFGFRHWGDPGDEPSLLAFRDWFLGAGFAMVIDPFHAVYGVQDILTNSGLPWRNCDPPLEMPAQLAAGLGVSAIWHEAVTQWQLDPVPRTPPSAAPFIPAWRRQAAQRYLEAAWPEGAGPLVGLAPVASSLIKRWPPERMRRIAEWLRDEWRARLLVFGLDPQQQALRREFAELGGQVRLVEPIHLQETAALLAACSGFVSNDTGLMHLAAAVGAATVGLFGPTAAHLYLPPGARAVASPRPCDYRLNHRFGPPACVHAGRCLIAADSCIDDIASEEVWAALSALLCEAAPRRQAQPRDERLRLNPWQAVFQQPASQCSREGKEGV